MMDSPDGPRQIDVLLTGRVGPYPSKTIIECKDYNKIVDVTAVDNLCEKRDDVGANKAVLVARKGFSKTARQKAKRKNIALCTSQAMLKDRCHFDLEIPLLIEEQQCFQFDPLCKFIADERTRNGPEIESTYKINDIPVPKIIADYWNNYSINCEQKITHHIFHPNIPEPHYLRHSDGSKIFITDLSIKLYIRKKYYFGRANDFESARYIHYLEENKHHVIIDPREMAGYREKLDAYEKLEDISLPDEVITLSAKILITPNVDLELRDFYLGETKPGDR